MDQLASWPFVRHLADIVIAFIIIDGREFRMCNVCNVFARINFVGNMLEVRKDLAVVCNISLTCILNPDSVAAQEACALLEE